MTGMTVAALLAMMGGSAWIAPISSLDSPSRLTLSAVVPPGEYHTFVVGNAAECRVDPPRGVKPEVFVVWTQPKYVYGKWRILAYYMPTVKQHEPTGLW